METRLVFRALRRNSENVIFLSFLFPLHPLVLEVHLVIERSCLHARLRRFFYVGS